MKTISRGLAFRSSTNLATSSAVRKPPDLISAKQKVPGLDFISSTMRPKVTAFSGCGQYCVGVEMSTVWTVLSDRSFTFVRKMRWYSTCAINCKQFYYLPQQYVCNDMFTTININVWGYGILNASIVLTYGSIK